MLEVPGKSCAMNPIKFGKDIPSFPKYYGNHSPTPVSLEHASHKFHPVDVGNRSRVLHECYCDCGLDDSADDD